MTKELTMILALVAGAVEGATVRGTVVENQSGHPLARATVTLQPVGAGSAAQSVRTNSYGIFEFPALAAGVYVVSAARLAFAPVQYGQKRWHSSGMPITLTANDSAFLTIRMPRYGAIAGTVLDENDVGLPEHEVAVYTNTRPPKLLARARTDDRGMYRLFGLQPGSYLVRSMSKLYDDGGYLPTFFRDSHTVDPVSYTHLDVYKRQVLEGAPARRILDRRDTGGIESSQTGTWGALAGGKGISRQERRSTRAKPPSRPFSEWPTIRSEGIDYWLCLLYTSRCV